MKAITPGISISSSIYYARHNEHGVTSKSLGGKFITKFTDFCTIPYRHH